jgi:hypothetical protein
MGIVGVVPDLLYSRRSQDERTACLRTWNVASTA